MLVRVQVMAQMTLKPIGEPFVASVGEDVLRQVRATVDEADLATGAATWAEHITAAKLSMQPRGLVIKPAYLGLFGLVTPVDLFDE